MKKTVVLASLCLLALGSSAFAKVSLSTNDGKVIPLNKEQLKEETAKAKKEREDKAVADKQAIKDKIEAAKKEQTSKSDTAKKDISDAKKNIKDALDNSQKASKEKAAADKQALKDSVKASKVKAAAKNEENKKKAVDGTNKKLEKLGLQIKSK